MADGRGVPRILPGGMHIFADPDPDLGGGADLDPDPHQNFELDPDPALDPHQNNADPQPLGSTVKRFLSNL